ncbi:SDR family oxidoreductase [Aureimonas altamirensis]|uniref:SDR family oxidoreductase n=1 Tax=Aureimonas TaxID=414371 RepID=UPI0017842D4C|nr:MULTISPECIES: SDR family oxidoreductase [Aureimonas]MCM2504254.1 SDR family oxidoreductase [Aureimonas altamirensis]QOG05170.1 SDR family oxidoreductase [Aureimonas sp. OT7]
MRVFLTGATGFIGSRILPQLLAAGHQVIGNARSEAGARRLEQVGAAVHSGNLSNPEGLAKGAETADAVIHTAFDHDFSRYAENCEKDRRVIEAIGDVLVGSDRPLLITSAIGMGSPRAGEFAREDVLDRNHLMPRIASELAGLTVGERGVSVGVVRLSQVHDPVKQGLVSPLIALSRQTGVSAYVGDGSNRWCAAAVEDVARLYVLALERHEPGARWHAVTEEALSFRSIAEAIGDGLDVPVTSLTESEAKKHFGWMAGFAAFDMPGSGAITRERLGWVPEGPTLSENLARMDYSAIPA